MVVAVSHALAALPAYCNVCKLVIDLLYGILVSHCDIRTAAALIVENIALKRNISLLHIRLESGKRFVVLEIQDRILR